MRRSRIDISVDILSASMGGANKTKIVYDAYLNFKQAEEYLNLLKSSGLIAEDKSNGNPIYKTTEKGIQMLDRYKELTEKVKI